MQAFGQSSKEHLSSQGLGRYVIVQCDKHNRYGRHIGKVFLVGDDINMCQVAVGVACHYKAHQRELLPVDGYY